MLNWRTATLIYIMILSLSAWMCGGCAITKPVRHLSSDVCLVLPESTTKSEVLAFLGEPNNRITNNDSSETWIYYKKKEDLLRKLPLIGKKFGSLNYEIVTVSFTGNLVRTCVYRQMTQYEITDSPDAPRTIIAE